MKKVLFFLFQKKIFSFKPLLGLARKFCCTVISFFHNSKFRRLFLISFAVRKILKSGMPSSASAPASPPSASHSQNSATQPSPRKHLVCFLLYSLSRCFFWSLC